MGIRIFCLIIIQNCMLMMFPLLASPQHGGDSIIIVRNIQITGNKKTRDKIVLRELTVREGDTLRIMPEGYSGNFTQSINNLRNTSLFHFVSMDTCNCEEAKCDVQILLTERWYTWPFPIFELSERNFNVWWEHKDFSRVNYGCYIVQENFRGRKEIVKLLLRFGYDKKFSLSYKLPFISRKMRAGMSFSLGYSSNHETPYRSLNNGQVFLKSSNGPIRQNYFLSAEYVYRKGHFTAHTFNVFFDRYLFSDTLHQLNIEFPEKGGANFTGLFYSISVNKRDFNTYPLKGYYFYAEANQRGLGIMSGERKQSSLSVKFSYRHYFRLSKLNFFSFGLILKSTLAGETPYYIQKGLGYGEETVRAYEYYVIDGKHFALIKSQYRFRILGEKIIRLKFLKTEKFNTIPVGIYLNLFSDGGYAGSFRSDPLNPLDHTLLVGSGAGIDLVTYYDKVLRLEYSINRKKEHGLFIHFSSPF
jgi:outer membrane protein assembly factor BamA